MREHDFLACLLFRRAYYWPYCHSSNGGTSKQPTRYGFQIEFLGCTLTLRSVIGILAQPTGDNKASYIAASYVKYIESSGGRVVPIDYRWSTEKLRSVFSKVNGILFPGGGKKKKTRLISHYATELVFFLVYLGKTKVLH